MISAKLQYRNYIPEGLIAIEFSDLRFSGDEEVVACLNNLRYAIEFEKSNNHDIEIDQICKQKEENLQKWITTRQKIKEFKRKHKLYFLSKNLQSMNDELIEIGNKLAQEDENFSLQIKKLEDDRYFKAVVLTSKFKHLLAELGFTCKDVSCTEGNKNLEVYESTCPDDELMARAQAMYVSIIEQQNRDNEDHCQ